MEEDCSREHTWVATEKQVCVQGKGELSNKDLCLAWNGLPDVTVDLYGDPRPMWWGCQTKGSYTGQSMVEPTSEGPSKFQVLGIPSEVAFLPNNPLVLLVCSDLF